MVAESSCILGTPSGGPGTQPIHEPRTVAAAAPGLLHVGDIEGAKAVLADWLAATTVGAAATTPARDTCQDERHVE